MVANEVAADLVSKSNRGIFSKDPYESVLLKSVTIHQHFFSIKS